MRDYQRTRMYKAEKSTDAWKFGRLSPFRHRVEASRFIYKVSLDEWTVSAFGRETAPEIRYIAGDRRYARGDAHFIELPPWALFQMVILHELAHSINEWLHNGYENISAHGPEFCGMYLHMVYRFLGDKPGEELQRAYHEFGVDYEVFDSAQQPEVTDLKEGLHALVC